MSEAVWFFLRRYWRISIVLVCVLVVAAVLEALSVGALFPLVTEILGVKRVDSGGRLLSVLHAALALMPIRDPVQSAVLFLVLLVTLKAFAMLLRDYLTAAGGAQIVFDTKQELFTRLRHAHYQYFIDHRHEEISYRLTTAPQSLGLALLLISSAVAQGIIVLTICALLVTISWQLTLGLMALGGLLHVVLRHMSKRVSHVVGKQRTEALTRELGVASEYLGGIKEIITAQAASRWSASYRNEGEVLKRLQVKDSLWQALPGVTIEWVFFVIVGTVAVVQQAAGRSGVTAAIPILAVYSYALYRMIRALSLVSAYKLRLASQLADVELLYRALQERFPVPSRVGIRSINFMHAIEFEGVSFRYPTRSDYALSQVNLKIPRGATVAIVGRSGSGKTTLMNLLLCLYGPSEGRLAVDGKDLSQCHPEAWLGLIGYVSQEAFLLNDTIAENIRFGLAGCSDTKVEAAARAAYAHEFILELPRGYATEVGARGMALSGGQRQRIAIARALLRSPGVMIFDEATSALDEASEAMIQKAIDEAAKQHTIIVIAHRVSTVRYADRIFVMDGGRIVEAGTHEELLAHKGHYSLLMASSLA